MKKKTKTIIVCSVVGFVIAAFFITSAVLSSVHGNGQNFVAEWQAWGNFFKSLIK